MQKKTKKGSIYKDQIQHKKSEVPVLHFQTIFKFYLFASLEGAQQNGVFTGHYSGLLGFLMWPSFKFGRNKADFEKWVICQKKKIRITIDWEQYVQEFSRSIF